MDNRYATMTLDELARDDRFRRWVIHRDPEAERFWTAWLVQHPDGADKLQVARAFLLALEEENTSLSATSLEEITDDIVRVRAGRPRPLWQRASFRVAAGIAIALGFGFIALLVWRRTDRAALALENDSPVTGNVVKKANATSRIQSIRLEDGSLILLYPNSTLRYPTHFSATDREVHLVGKAFFTVAKKPSQPFWVYTNTLTTQVLGTSFLVSALADDGQANVVVKSGRVSVYRSRDVAKARQEKRHERAGVILTPNQQVAYTPVDERLVKTVVANPSVVTPGAAEAFIFEETPIAEVFALLEKTYGLPVLYDAPNMRHCYLTADLTDESLYDTLSLICKITRSTYEIVDGQIVVHSQGCRN